MDKNYDNGNNNKKAKPYLIAGLVGLMGIVGAYMPSVLMVLPAFLGYVGTAFGMGCFALSAAVATGALYVLCDAIDASYMLLIMLPAAFVLYYSFKKKASYRTTVGAATGALAVGYYLYLCLPSILAGKDAFYEVETLIKYYADTMKEIGGMLNQSAAASGAAAAMFETAVGFAPEITILLTLLFAMAFGFFDVIIARLLLKHEDNVELRPMAPFREWQLSRSFTIGALVLVGGALILSLMNMKNSSALLVAVDCLFSFPIMLMGACLVDFFIRAARRNVGVKRALFIVAFFLLLPYSGMFLFIIGIVDRLFKIRKRFRIKQL